MGRIHTSAVVIASLATLSGTHSSIGATRDSARIDEQFPPTASEVAPDGYALPDDSTLLARLNVFLGFETAAEAIATAETAHYVVACMQNSEFQYEPVNWAAEDPRYEMEREEFAATYGLGIVAHFLGRYPGTEDPQAEYVQGLTPGQRDAYYRAEERCADPWGEGEPRAFGNAERVAVEQFRPSVESDERAVDSLARWRDCMLDAGFDFEEPVAMKEYFSEAAYETDDLEALFEEELLVADANLDCEPDHRSVVRSVITDRFNEYKELLESALSDSAEPGGAG